MSLVNKCATVFILLLLLSSSFFVSCCYLFRLWHIILFDLQWFVGNHYYHSYFLSCVCLCLCVCVCVFVLCMCRHADAIESIKKALAGLVSVSELATTETDAPTREHAPSLQPQQPQQQQQAKQPQQQQQQQQPLSVISTDPPVRQPSALKQSTGSGASLSALSSAAAVGTPAPATPTKHAVHFASTAEVTEMPAAGIEPESPASQQRINARLVIAGFHNLAVEQVRVDLLGRGFNCYCCWYCAVAVWLGLRYCLHNACACRHCRGTFIMFRRLTFCSFCYFNRYSCASIRRR